MSKAAVNQFTQCVAMGKQLLCKATRYLKQIFFCVSYLLTELAGKLVRVNAVKYEG